MVLYHCSVVPEPGATLELKTTGVPEHVAKLPDCTLTTGADGTVPVVTVIALLGKLGQLRAPFRIGFHHLVHRLVLPSGLAGA